MPSIYEEVQEPAVWRDMVDGFRLDVKNVEVYLKQFIVWIRIMVSVVLVLSLGTIFSWNFFAPTSKEVSDRVIVKFVNAIDLQYRVEVIVLEEPDRLSSTSIIPPNGST